MTESEGCGGVIGIVVSVLRTLYKIRIIKLSTVELKKLSYHERLS